MFTLFTFILFSELSFSEVILVSVQEILLALRSCVPVVLTMLPKYGLMIMLIKSSVTVFSLLEQLCSVWSDWLL